MVLWLCVPLREVFVARNWNLAISLCSLTAATVANRAAVSTPLSGWAVVVIGFSWVGAGRTSGWVVRERLGKETFPGSVESGRRPAGVSPGRRPDQRARRRPGTSWATIGRRAPPPA